MATSHSTLCAVEDCNRKVASRGVCSTHYNQWYKGDTSIPVKPSKMERLSPIHCGTCGISFKPERARNKYCSRRCQWDALKNRVEVDCGHCGTRFAARFNQGSDKNSLQKFCSKSCAGMEARKPLYSRVYFRRCSQCESLFIARRSNVRTCSKECQQDRERSVWVPVIRPAFDCRECGATHSPEPGVKRREFCSDACGNRYHRRVRRSRERARLRGAQVEPVNPFKVFDRDGWRCQICRKQTPKASRGTTKSNAPELDHRVPLANGGEHSYANTQCACRQCNHLKGNSSSVGQMPLLSAV